MNGGICIHSIPAQLWSSISVPAGGFESPRELQSGSLLVSLQPIGTGIATTGQFHIIGAISTQNDEHGSGSVNNHCTTD